MARSGRTFALASRLLPTRARANAAELYAFCRRMDDLADEPENEPKNELGIGEPCSLAGAIAALRADPLGEAAAEAGWPVALEEQYPGIFAVAVALLEALAADTGPRRIATEEELLRYAFGVAGTVGLMMCRILGAPPNGAAAASRLGMAMQLTNIARDVHEDWERGRVYLPAEWLSPERVGAALNGESGTELASALAKLLALADRYYRSAHAGMRLLPLRTRAAILAAASCYREIGVLVGKAPELSWQRRAVVGGPRKAALVFRSLAQAPAMSLSRCYARGPAEVESIP